MNSTKPCPGTCRAVKNDHFLLRREERFLDLLRLRPPFVISQRGGGKGEPRFPLLDYVYTDFS